MRHYRRWLKYGDPTRTHVAEYGAGLDFIRSIPVTDDCVLWPFARIKGYGVLQVGDLQVRAHRHSLSLVEPPPFEGAVARHGPCHNRACVNPRHLSWGTHQDNVNDRRRDGTWSRGRPR